MFDEDLGDLFVIRVAGNVVDPIVLGSIEYAAAHLGTRLLVVLGHTSCGAVKATLDAMQNPPDEISPNIQALVDAIQPAVAPLLAQEPPLAEMALGAAAVRANVASVVAQLGRESALLTSLMGEDGLEVIGAEYDLGSGAVTFLS